MKKDWLLRIMGCLAFGGMGAVIVMCFFIGFGFGTVIGKEAVYLCLLLETLHLLVLRRRARALLRSGAAPQPAKRMRRLHLAVVWIWRCGAILLLVSLGLLLCGLSPANTWVSSSCWVGFVLILVGWLGNLLTFQRLRQSAVALSIERSRAPVAK